MLNVRFDVLHGIQLVGFESLKVFFWNIKTGAVGCFF